MGRKIVVVSGHFQFCHRGHVDYLRRAKEFAGPDGLLYVIVNSDHQSVLKKGFSFVPQEDRMALLEAVRYTDKVVLSVDMDRTVRQTLRSLCDADGARPTHFANGGDVDVCAEEDACRDLGIEMVYGLGDKIQSSSWILEHSVRAAYLNMSAA